jgi:hypothetical protein
MDRQLLTSCDALKNQSADWPEPSATTQINREIALVDVGLEEIGSALNEFKARVASGARDDAGQTDKE